MDRFEKFSGGKIFSIYIGVLRKGVVGRDAA